MKIRLFLPKDKPLWDSFLKNARNPHFMFLRDYMDYHSDRFEDCSILFEDEKGNLVAVLPANLTAEKVLFSHQGLTFGGLILDSRSSMGSVSEMFELLLDFCREKEIKKIVYKCMPYIYFLQPSEEDRYALFKNRARLFRRDISSTIYLHNRGTYSKGRKWSVNKAKKADLTFERSFEWDLFWIILEEALQKQHQVKPVHSVGEIKLLANLFPENIKLFVAKKSSEIVAGTVIFENRNLVHTQYLANTTLGREVGGLDFVVDQLLDQYSISKQFFDFGISNEDGGWFLNLGLIAQKEGFGARGVVHDFYEMVIE